MRGTLAVVTMVYNESYFLPLWKAHYSSQVGKENCFIVDNGSDDGSLDGVDNVIKISQRSLDGSKITDEASRSKFISKLCASLLVYYERVMYTDVDEIIIADPIVSNTLFEFAKRDDLPSVVTVLGMDVIHRASIEPEIDLGSSILSQRTRVRAHGALCKPLMINHEIAWGHGFHSWAGGRVFHGLYMFHLAYFDEKVTFARQVKRNGHSFTNNDGQHHAIPPDVLVDHLRSSTSLNEVDPEFGSSCLIESRFTKYITTPGNEVSQAAELWVVPERFRNLI